MRIKECWPVGNHLLLFWLQVGLSSVFMSVFLTRAVLVFLDPIFEVRKSYYFLIRSIIIFLCQLLVLGFWLWWHVLLFSESLCGFIASNTNFFVALLHFRLILFRGYLNIFVFLWFVGFLLIIFSFFF